MTSDTEKCKLYNTNKNGTANPFHIENSYGGIPQNLLTNTILLTILLAAFLVIRKSAFKVFNKMKVNNIEKWTHTFFSFASHMFDRTEKGDDSSSSSDHDSPTRPLSKNDVRDDTADAEEEEEQGSAVSPHRRPPSVSRSLSISESITFWQWLKSIFTI